MTTAVLKPESFAGELPEKPREKAPLYATPFGPSFFAPKDNVNAGPFGYFNEYETDKDGKITGIVAEML